MWAGGRPRAEPSRWKTSSDAQGGGYEDLGLFTVEEQISRRKNRDMREGQTYRNTEKNGRASMQAGSISGRAQPHTKRHNCFKLSGTSGRPLLDSRVEFLLGNKGDPFGDQPRELVFPQGISVLIPLGGGLESSRVYTQHGKIPVSTSLIQSAPFEQRRVQPSWGGWYSLDYAFVTRNVPLFEAGAKVRV